MSKTKILGISLMAPFMSFMIGGYIYQCYKHPRAMLEVTIVLIVVGAAGIGAKILKRKSAKEVSDE